MAYTNNDIYNLINFTIRKDKKGQPLTLENFSLLLNTKSDEYYELLYNEYEKTQEITDSIRRFKEEKSGAQLSFTGTTIDLPSDYAHRGYLYHKKGGTDIRDVELVDDDIFMMRQTSVIEIPSVDYPIGRFITSYIEYLPSTLDQNNFTFSYLRNPTVPFYDYYIDANGVVQYLIVGATHTWVTGETDSSGVVHTTGDADWNSLTVELDYEEDDKIKIA